MGKTWTPEQRLKLDICGTCKKSAYVIEGEVKSDRDESPYSYDSPDECPHGYLEDLHCDECDGPLECQRCDEYGQVVVCVDDMCRGAGECFHGDGMGQCPDCGGEGKL